MAATARQLPVVWPLHPRTRAALQKAGKPDALAVHVQLINPVGYVDMVQLEKFAALIATDSGGVENEAFLYQVPCVTLRDETEWMELVEAGWNSRLAPPQSLAAVANAVAAAIASKGQQIQPYGKGNASKKIVNTLKA